MDKSKLEELVLELRTLNKQADEISERVEMIKTTLKNEMNETGVYELSGDDWSITWKSVSSNRFDQSSFKEQHEDLFAQYTRISESRRFLLNTY